MSADAGGTGADKRMEERAIAAEKAFNEDEAVEDCSSEVVLAEQTMVVVVVAAAAGLDFTVK